MTAARYVRSLILFARVPSLMKLLKAFRALDELTSKSQFNDFYAKTAFNELQRHEEALLYGKPLTFDQRETQNQLFQLLPREDQVHQLFIGRYIGGRGQLIGYAPVERFLLLLALVVLSISVIATLKIAVEVSSQPIPTAPTVGFLITLAFIIGIPCFHLCARCIAPSFTYLSKLHILKSL